MKYNGEYTLSTIPKPKRTAKTGRKTDGSQVDWNLIRQKVLQTSANLAWIDNVPQEVLDQTWAERAKKMAQIVEEGDGGEQLQIAVIRLGREVYGLETDYIFEIRMLEQVTHVPRVPDWVAGVANLRGRIISVVDLQRFLRLPPGEKADAADPPPHHLVVVETPAMELGLLVDEVLAIESLPTNQIQEATSAVRGIQPEYMRGIVLPSHTEGDITPQLILDLPALLADKRLIVHEDII